MGASVGSSVGGAVGSLVGGAEGGFVGPIEGCCMGLNGSGSEEGAAVRLSYREGGAATGGPFPSSPKTRDGAAVGEETESSLNPVGVKVGDTAGVVGLGPPDELLDGLIVMP